MTMPRPTSSSPRRRGSIFLARPTHLAMRRWIPAFAGMTEWVCLGRGIRFAALEVDLRWVPALARMTVWGCRGRRNRCAVRWVEKGWLPGFAGMTVWGGRGNASTT